MPERLLPTAEQDTRMVRVHLARYEFASSFVAGKSALDVACGSGYGSAHLADHGATRVTGIDISEEAVAGARERYRRPGLEFLCRDVHDLSGIGLVQVVTSFETIEHLAEPAKFLREVSRLMEPGGVLLISTPVRQSGSLQDRPENPFHVREWNTAEFTALLREHFARVDILHQYEVKKSWFPYSRTLRRGAMALLARPRAEVFESFPVLSSPPRTGGIAVSESFVLGVCLEPVNAGSQAEPRTPLRTP